MWLFVSVFIQESSHIVLYSCKFGKSDQNRAAAMGMGCGTLQVMCQFPFYHIDR